MAHYIVLCNIMTHDIVAPCWEKYIGNVQEFHNFENIIHIMTLFKLWKPIHDSCVCVKTHQLQLKQTIVNDSKSLPFLIIWYFPST